MNKEYRLTIRFTEKEYHLLKKKQKKTTSTLAGFVRKLALGQLDQIESKDKVETMKLFLFNYAAFGHNLNQIAKVLNTQLKVGHNLHLSSDEMKSIAALERMIDQWDRVVRDVDVFKLK